MVNNYIVLIDYSDCSTEYREFDSYTEAKSFIERVLEPDEGVEYAQIIKAESQYSWSNPNCSPEEDF